MNNAVYRGTSLYMAAKSKHYRLLSLRPIFNSRPIHLGLVRPHNFCCHHNTRSNSQHRPLQGPEPSSCARRPTVLDRVILTAAKGRRTPPSSLGPQDARARLLLVKLVRGLDAVAALEIGEGLARVGRGRADHLVVLDLVLGDLPGRREDGEEGDDAEGQADGCCCAEGEPPACVGGWPRQL